MSEKIKISRKNLECSYLFQIYVFWKGVQTFHLKNSENLGFLCYFVKAKTKKCNKKNLSFLDQFRMLKFAFDTCFLKVNVHASLKVATKGSFRCQKILIFTTFKAFFVKQKWMSKTKKIEVSVINLASLYLVQLHFF